MAIELFSIGTELVLGQIQDTNAHWIAQRTLKSGGELRRVTMVRDNSYEMSEALQSTIERKTPLVLTTGGLGPTPDDMTVTVVAELTGSNVVPSEETLATFRERRQLSKNEPLNDALIKMAQVPEGAQVFQNPVGWAPCIQVVHKQSTLLLMPGPPSEMKAIFETYIQPMISEKYSTGMRNARIYVNMFEAEVSPLMQNVMERYPDVYLKAYVSLRELGSDAMPVDIVSLGTDSAAAEKQLQLATDYFRTLVTETGKQFSLEKKS